jgi:hypothetical protein
LTRVRAIARFVVGRAPLLEPFAVRAPCPVSESGTPVASEFCRRSAKSPASKAQGRLRHRIDYVSNEHLADRSGARQRKIDVQTPTKVPVRVLANRPRWRAGA